MLAVPASTAASPADPHAVASGEGVPQVYAKSKTGRSRSATPTYEVIPGRARARNASQSLLSSSGSGASGAEPLRALPPPRADPGAANRSPAPDPNRPLMGKTGPAKSEEKGGPLSGGISGASSGGVVPGTDLPTGVGSRPGGVSGASSGGVVPGSALESEKPWGWLKSAPSALNAAQNPIETRQNATQILPKT